MSAITRFCLPIESPAHTVALGSAAAEDRRSLGRGRGEGRCSSRCQHLQPGNRGFTWASLTTRMALEVSTARLERSRCLAEPRTRFPVRPSPCGTGCDGPTPATALRLREGADADEGGTMTATDSGPGASAPMTGQEYLDSLRDGREVWAYGERVKDVTTHPAFRNSARSIARLYDSLHDPNLQDVLTVP